MRQCLNDKELLTVHAGDGSGQARMHLETCLAVRGGIGTLTATCNRWSQPCGSLLQLALVPES